MNDTAESIQRAARQILPRILTQGCRDPHSPHRGCFDRNWWHYKIRDFPSLILQQAGYAAWLAIDESDPASAESLRRIAGDACRFWNHRAIRHGAFEEYYPWEQGYPPLAFSTLAVMKLAAQGAIEPAAVEPGARVAATQLLERFESQAANQQVAGLAALAWIRHVFPALVTDEGFARQADRTLALQYDEGWYEEYGGPDLGYLSVTIDCLWDLFDATGEDRFRASAFRAAGFIAAFLPVTGGSIGLHNARNTDYLVPYGLARTAIEGGPDLLTPLWQGADQPDHFLAATDDRYLCHYIGASVLRAAHLLKTKSLPAITPPETGADRYFAGSGHVLRTGAQRALISLRKGGVFSLFHGGGSASDFGWLVELGEQQFVQHWWSSHWTSSGSADTWTIQGVLVPHREHESTPWKHMALRLASFAIGRRLIAALKSVLIFRKRLSPYRLSRTITLRADGAHVEDRIDGLPDGPDLQIRPASRSSKRHVASADSYHPEDLRLAHGYEVRREITRDAGTFRAVTTYTRRT